MFVESPSGAKWTMLDDDPVHEHSKVAIPQSALEFHIPPGVAVIPGWPFLSGPGRCSLPGCE
ncbi:hypothetical protein ACFCZ1_26655 [Streptomyces sp. NPDC056224]|uniref:hypothetical protein n=1 Tax=Streptomyces sp. NPDC056224 TaxID=3345750 RepID=UPI0035D9A772